MKSVKQNNGNMPKKYIVTIIVILTAILLGSTVLFFFNKKEKTFSLKSYNPDKKITDVSQYVLRDGDTVLEGKFAQYNQKGTKIAEGNFVNGHINGKSVYYFDNGNIESIHYRKNSKITEESTYNYSNGKVRKYVMYDDFGILDFLINYDELGNVKNYQGLPLIEIYQYKIANNKQFQVKTNQVLKIGDTLKYQYLIANIPNAKRSFKLQNLSVNNAKVKRTFKQIPPTGLNIKEVLTKKGLNTIIAVVRYEFNDKEKTVINDSISFNIKVN